MYLSVNDKGVFQVEALPIDYSLLRKYGFCYDRKTQLWKTPFHQHAEKVFKGMDLHPSALSLLDRYKNRQIKRLLASRALDAPGFHVPKPDNLDADYLPFQRAGIKTLLGETKSLLADPMGLGKTIQVIGMTNLAPDVEKVLVVCPASGKYNWVREWIRWHTRGLSVDMANGPTFPQNADVIVINYDILFRHLVKIRSIPWDLVVLDEAHYLRNRTAQRTQAVYGGKNRDAGIHAPRTIAVTGTPIVNRPIELFPTLQHLLPEGFPRVFDYAKRYCQAHRMGQRWDYSGASHMEELQEKLRSTIMIRRSKERVLPQLPPKRRQIIELEPTTNRGKTLRAKEQGIIEQLKAELGLPNVDEGVLSDEQYKEVIKSLSVDVGEDMKDTPIATLRRESAIEKVPGVIRHIEDTLEAVDKVVCFVWHKDVVMALRKHFNEKAVCLIGGMTAKQKDASVRVFQKNPKVPLFIGNILAAGTVIDLTVAKHVIFAEMDWVPGNLCQAEDRCHRITQREQVLVQYLITAGGLDSLMAKTTITKQAIIDKGMDAETFTERMLR